MRNPRRTCSCSIESVYMTTGDSSHGPSSPWTIHRIHRQQWPSRQSEKEKPTAAVFKKGDSTRKHFRSITSFGLADRARAAKEKTSLTKPATFVCARHALVMPACSVPTHCQNQEKKIAPNRICSLTPAALSYMTCLSPLPMPKAWFFRRSRLIAKASPADKQRRLWGMVPLPT